MRKRLDTQRPLNIGSFQPVWAHMPVYRPPRINKIRQIQNITICVWRTGHTQIYRNVRAHTPSRLHTFYRANGHSNIESSKKEAILLNTSPYRVYPDLGTQLSQRRARQLKICVATCPLSMRHNFRRLLSSPDCVTSTSATLLRYSNH
jgi:hypothetical protein